MMRVGGAGGVPPKAGIVDGKRRIIDRWVRLEDAVNGAGVRATDCIRNSQLKELR